MRLRKTIPASVIGTSAMTAFSYFVSHQKHNNFKEPEILGKLIYRLDTALDKTASQISGWGFHYLVGLLFTELYAPMWEKTSIAPTTGSGLVFGGLSGLAAILVWKFTLDIHPDPPSLNFKKYAGALFVAHIVFGVFVAIGFNLLKPAKLPQV